MNKKLLPITAGIVDIVYGVGGTTYGIFYCLYGEGDWQDKLVFIGGWLILFGIIAIIGGGFTLARRNWALSAIGTIAGLIVSFPFIYSIHILIVVLPMIAIILIILSRKQFIR